MHPAQKPIALNKTRDGTKLIAFFTLHPGCCTRMSDVTAAPAAKFQQNKGFSRQIPAG